MYEYAISQNSSQMEREEVLQILPPQREKESIGAYRAAMLRVRCRVRHILLGRILLFRLRKEFLS